MKRLTQFLLWFGLVSLGLVFFHKYADNLSVDVRGLFLGFTLMALFAIAVIYTVIAPFIIKSKTALKSVLIFWGVIIYCFIFLIDMIYIPFYYLYPTYYDFKSQCEKIPEPIIYNQDYWNVWLHFKKLKLYEQDGTPKTGLGGPDKGIPYYYSKRLDKKFEDKWEHQNERQETWWGEITISKRFNDGFHFATTTQYRYQALIFQFGASSVDFYHTTMVCKNYKRDSYCDPDGSCSYTGKREDL